MKNTEDLYQRHANTVRAFHWTDGTEEQQNRLREWLAASLPDYDTKLMFKVSPSKETLACFEVGDDDLYVVEGEWIVLDRRPDDRVDVDTLNDDQFRAAFEPVAAAAAANPAAPPANTRTMSFTAAVNYVARQWGGIIDKTIVDWLCQLPRHESSLGYSLSEDEFRFGLFTDGRYVNLAVKPGDWIVAELDFAGRLRGIFVADTATLAARTGVMW